METSYKVAMVSYLANGGDGLKVFKERATERLMGPLDSDVFSAYIRRIEPVTQGVEGRSKILMPGQMYFSGRGNEWGGGGSSAAANSSSTSLLVLLPILLISIFSMR